MKLSFKIARDETGDMAGKLCLRVFDSDNVVYTCYVRSLEQAIFELKEFALNSLEDDGADICWKP